MRLCDARTCFVNSSLPGNIGKHVFAYVSTQSFLNWRFEHNEVIVIPVGWSAHPETVTAVHGTVGSGLVNGVGGCTVRGVSVSLD